MSKKTPVGSSPDYKKWLQCTLRNGPPACKEYLSAVLEDFQDLPKLFAGQPGSHCLACGSDNVNVKGLTWTCLRCEKKGELRAVAVLAGDNATFSLEQDDPPPEKADPDEHKRTKFEVYWEVEAKKAFAERDELKRKLREAAPSVAAEEHRKQFIRDIEWKTVELGKFKGITSCDGERFTSCDGERFSLPQFYALLETIERTGKTVLRMDCPAEFITALRGLGTSLFDSSTLREFSQNGIMGSLHIPAHPGIDIFLNNKMKDKIRLFLEDVGYREYEFPDRNVDDNEIS